jgi:hypothetical protein
LLQFAVDQGLRDFGDGQRDVVGIVEAGQIELLRAKLFHRQVHVTSFLAANAWSPAQASHHLTINVTGILTGCTLELELVAVTVIV